MNSYLALTKTFISALSMSKSNDLKKRRLVKTLSFFALFGIMIPCAIMLGFFVGSMTNELMGTGVESFALQLVLEVIAIFSFVFGITVILNELYFSNDIEYLLPWPLKIWQIVASKFTAAYFAENIMQVLFTIAAIIGFGIVAGISGVGWVLAILGFLLLPILPMVYCTILNMVMMRFTRIIKNKDVLQKVTIFMIFAIMFLVLIAVGSIGEFNFEGFSGDISEIGNAYFGVLNIIFPTIKLFISAVSDGNILAFLGYVGLNVLAIIVMLVIAELIYFKGVINLSVNNHASNDSLSKVLDKSKKMPVAVSYFMKEVKILMRTPTFYTHCVIANFIWPVFVYAIFKATGSGITVSWIRENYLSNLDIQLFGVVFIIGISAFIVSLSGISSNAISREGKHFHFMKGIPVNYKIQWHVKAFVGNLFAYLGIMVYFVPICILLDIPFWHVVAYRILSVLAIQFISYMSIYIDSIQPKLVWDDELSVLRENYNMFFSMAIVLLFGAVVCIGGYFFLRQYSLSFGKLFVIFGGLLILCNLFIWLISRKGIIKNIEEQEEM